MVAITVILAAVVGAFVLNLGGGQESPPQVDWAWSDQPDNESVLLEHNGGERVDNPDLIIMSGGLNNSDYTLDQNASTWSAGTNAYVPVNADTAGPLELVWESSDGPQSQIVDSHDYDTSS